MRLENWSIGGQFKNNMEKTKTRKENADKYHPEKNSEERIDRLLAYLKDIQGIGLTMDTDQRRLVKRRIMQALLEIEDLDDYVTSLFKELDVDPEYLINKEDQSVDPSIQYFGLEWNSVLRKWKTIKDELQNLQDSWSRENVDVDRISYLQNALASLADDLSNHSTAVFRNSPTLEVPTPSIRRSSSCTEGFDEPKRKQKSSSFRRMLMKTKQWMGLQPGLDDSEIVRSSTNLRLTTKRKSLSLDEGLDLKLSQSFSTPI